MKMFCSTGGDTSEAAIFQCPMATLRLRTSSENVSEPTILRSRCHNLNGKSCNGVAEDINRNRSLPNKNLPSTDKCTKAHTDSSSSYLKKLSKGNIDGVKVSSRMKELLEGLNEPGDSKNPPQEPEWLDRELFDQGRRFYDRYLFCIFFSDLLALLAMFSINRILKPLIYTDKSDTPGRALKRYVSTIMHIIAWFTGDVWNPNDKVHKDILSVRSIHNKAADQFNSSKNTDKLANSSVTKKGHLEPSCPFNPAIRQDLIAEADSGLVLESGDNPPLYISQWDMCTTQYSFLGLILAHPCRMGAWWVTQRDLEGLVHFWRGIGWLLGIEDKYNFCNGTAAETKALCLEMEKLVIVPSLSKVDWNHEHMAVSLIDGINQMVPGMSFPAMFRFLSDTLGLSVPSFVSKMGTKATCQYWFMRVVIHIFFIIPGVISIFNGLLKLALQVIQNQSPAWFPSSWKPPITIAPCNYT